MAPQPLLAALMVVCILSQAAVAQLKDAQLVDYEQWRLARKGAVADPKSLAVVPGFHVDLVRVAGPDEGSWISLAVDPRGRLIVGREDQGLLRLSLAQDGRSVEQVESIDKTLLECRGLLFAHDSLYVHANNSRGLYRLKDTDGDDQFDQVQLLRKTEGGVGHGRNGLALGPDGMIYLALGNNVQVPGDVSPNSPYRNYAVDRLLPCAWNEFLFDSDVVPPCGHIARTDPEGKCWELFAGGFRNPYGIDFNRDGQLFTYDADMEWDAGAPWYRPTTVLHVVAGGEYGWRQETNCWPDWYADSIPRVADIGLGSPTGVKFGHASQFPRKYQEAFYVLDWAYGRIIAVHLKNQLTGYTGTSETFLKGRPLNVTDLAFGPDGAMYFVVGGRRTQSALYRVSADKNAKADDETSSPRELSKEEKTALDRRSARPDIEQSYLGKSAAGNSYLKIRDTFYSDDSLIRNVARLGIERVPVDKWYSIALGEQNSQTAIPALLALVRVAPPSLGNKIAARLNDWLTEPLAEPERRMLLRSVQLALIRLGPLDANVKTKLARTLQSQYTPELSVPQRQMMCELLVALESPEVVAPTLDLFDSAESQEERLFYLFALRQVESGWTMERRRRYFAGLKRAESFSGAHYLQRFVTFIRTDALSTLTDDERRELAEVLSVLGKSGKGVLSAAATPARPEVRKWKLEDFSGALDEVEPKRNLGRGRKLFTEALCIRCHRKGTVGQPIGPDLDYVASRFGRLDLLETILVPSKVVEDKYRNLVLETDQGQVITGQLAGGSVSALFIAPEPLEPAQFVKVPRGSIVSRKTSPTSIMPEGLLNGFDREEILDLLWYLEAP